MQVDVSRVKINLEKELPSMTAQLSDLRAGNPNIVGADMTGWVHWASELPEPAVAAIQAAAEEIKRKCTLFILVGIGGSYLGSKAVIDAMGGSRAGYPEIVFAGFHMSAAYLDRLCERMKRESVCLCVISKSGGTMEPMLSYAILKQKMMEKYGWEEAHKRIIVITDKEKGNLRKQADQCGFTTFEVPDSIGGRYSVLTPVGLLPIAVAGHDIRALLRGAANMSRDPNWGSKWLDYAACRVSLQKAGKTLEAFAYFEQDFHYFGEWLRQLFGESEGKEGKGAYPTCLCFTRDLHSIGQFLQQGNQIFWETMISVEQHNADFVIPKDAEEPFAGKTLEQINACAEEGVIRAHEKIGIPIVVITIPCVDEYNIGQLIYFFEMSAALSAYALGVNPFDQPGVGFYKAETRERVRQL